MPPTSILLGKSNWNARKVPCSDAGEAKRTELHFLHLSFKLTHTSYIHSHIYAYVYVESCMHTATHTFHTDVQPCMHSFIQLHAQFQTCTVRL